MRVLRVLAAAAIWLSAGMAMGQSVWVQIEARPTRAEAEERARAYGGLFSDVSGYALSSGWHALVLGPQPTAEAEARLAQLRAEGLIPSDSFIADGTNFRDRFWPVGAGGTGGVAPAPATTVVPAESAAPVTAARPADESPAEARRSEAEMTRAERMLVQEALQWSGFYSGAIDGAFGRGTRASMSAWQAAMGHEQTGIMTAAQRAEAIDTLTSERASLGLEVLSEEEAGIEVAIPTALVRFDAYQPPFVRYGEQDGSRMQVLLISEPGDQNALSALYTLMQTLEIVPVDGARELRRSDFVINAQDDRRRSYTQAQIYGKTIKGFTLVWDAKDDARGRKVLALMRASFRPTGDRVLASGLGTPLSAPRDLLLTGLELRKPLRARSGFYLSRDGLIATTASAVAGCRRVTLGDGETADVLALDRGVALLKPQTPVAPRGHATLSGMRIAAGMPVAVVGYPYEDTLDTPVLTFGTLTGATDLDGAADRARLGIETRPGDAGGAVLDAAGRVIGLLAPDEDTGSRVLPEDVHFALPAETLAEVMQAANIPAEVDGADLPGVMAPEDLTALGRDMGVLVSCWD